MPRHWYDTPTFTFAPLRLRRTVLSTSHYREGHHSFGPANIFGPLAAQLFATSAIYRIRRSAANRAGADGVGDTAGPAQSTVLIGSIAPVLFIQRLHHSCREYGITRGADGSHPDAVGRDANAGEIAQPMSSGDMDPITGEKMRIKEIQAAPPLHRPFEFLDREYRFFEFDFIRGADVVFEHKIKVQPGARIKKSAAKHARLICQPQQGQDPRVRRNTG